ncbi:MAG: glucoamylase family protein [Bacteroidota bacterium]|nr:glucoamylase family protein [Bacteroidota bacterium]
MNKKTILLSVLILIFGNSFAEKVNYVLPNKLKGTGYSGHTELTWENRVGFVYDIYRSDDGNSNFSKIAESNSDNYLDFFGKQLLNDQTFYYRVMPKGLPVDSKSALKFQVSVPVRPATDSDLLDMTQRYTTRYFYDFADPATGLARERSNDANGNIVTIGGSGFGIMALIAGAERKYFSRNDAFKTIHKIVSFLEKTERFHGAWAHWYDANTGKVFSFSQFDDGGDLVETAFMMEGLLTAREYFRNGNGDEQALAKRITQLWETVEWNWYTQGKNALYWHWSKNYGFKLNHRITGFDETLITYILAASSPTYPIERSVYENGYTKSSYYVNGKKYFGIKLDLGMEYGGPLFFTHYSFLGLNPTGLSDKYTNYFERNKAHALIQVAYAIKNPKKHVGYGENCWGFTSSDDPIAGYTSHQPGTDEENGTISPTAAISSVVYTPKESIAALRYFYHDKGKILFGKYGFYDAFNAGLVDGQQVVHSYLAIDQGPIAVMIENYRSGLLWKLFMSNPEIHTGLQKLGFKQLTANS